MKPEDNSDSRSVSRAIDFPDANEALDLGAVPWEAYGEEDLVSQIDCDALTGNGKDEGGAEWGVIREALGAGLEPLSETSTAIGHGRRPIEVSWDTCAWYQRILFRDLEAVLAQLEAGHQRTCFIPAGSRTRCEPK